MWKATVKVAGGARTRVGPVILVMIPRAEWAANARRRKTGTNNLRNMVLGDLVKVER